MGNDKDLPRSSSASIGEKLKHAREKKSLTISQAQKETRIYSTILTALEEGRCDEMLPKTYVKSFLKKYSEYLGMGSNELVKEYLTIHPEDQEKGAININPAKLPGLSRGVYAVKLKRPDIFSKFIYIICFGLLLIAVLSLTAFLGRRAVSSRHKKADARKIETIPVKKAKLAAAPKVSAQVKSPQRKEAAPKVTAQSKAPFNLLLKVKQDTRVRLKKDGILLFDRVLPKGAVESFPAQDKIELYVAKAEAIELTLDNKPLGSPGKGVIKDLEITKNGVRIK